MGNGYSAFVAMNVGSLIFLPFSQKYLSLVIVTQKVGHQAPGIVGDWSCTLVSLCRIENATRAVNSAGPGAHFLLGGGA